MTVHKAVSIVSNEALFNLRQRAGNASRELTDLSHTACAEQKHLDEDSSEQAYWHHGYYSAIIDVFKLIGCEPSGIDTPIQGALVNKV